MVALVAKEDKQLLQKKFDNARRNYNSITGLKTLMKKGKPELAPLLSLNPAESENSRVMMRMTRRNTKGSNLQVNVTQVTDCNET